MDTKKSKCPNRYNRNKKTRNCEKKLVKKVCPNIKTKRCNKIKNKSVKLKNSKKLNIKKKVSKSSDKRIENKIFTNECKKNKNIEYVNLDKFKLIPDNICSNRPIGGADIFKISKGWNETIFFSLDYENTPICKSKYINKGVYGKVYEYSNNSNIKVAIKSFKYSNDSELKIIEKLNKLNINCNTINARLLNMGNSPNIKKFAIMNIMSGGLNKMNGKLNIKNIYLVIKQIAEHLKCLNKNKLSYTDLKTANILFKCIDNKEITTVLGDLGSICSRGSNNSCTWLPWDQRFTGGQPKCNESTMVWCLGVVMLELLKYNKINTFGWGLIPEINETEISRILSNINTQYKFNEMKFNNLTKYKNGGELFNGIFNLNNNKRITLDNIIKSIVF